MQKELSLEEKEKRWIEAQRRKEECRTDEEFDYEVLSETLYEDEEYIFFKECINTYTFRKKGVCGKSSELDFFLEASLSKIFHDESYEQQSFLDFMRDKGFPIIFKVW